MLLNFSFALYFLTFLIIIIVLLYVLSFNVLCYSEKVFLSSGGTRAVVKNSDGFYIVGEVSSPAESSDL